MIFLFLFFVLIGIVTFGEVFKAVRNPEETLAKHRISKGLGTRADYRTLNLPCPHHLRRDTKL